MVEVTFVCNKSIVKRMIPKKIWDDFEAKALEFWEYEENEVFYKYSGKKFVKL